MRCTQFFVVGFQQLIGSTNLEKNFFLRHLVDFYEKNFVPFDFEVVAKVFLSSLT